MKQPSVMNGGGGGGAGSVDERQNMKEGEEDEDEQCGIGRCHPKGVQGCAKLIFFTVILSFSGMCSVMQGPLFVSQVTSIERHFEMSSTQIGVLMSANDIGFMLLVLLVSHLAKDGHAPRMLGSAAILFATAAILIGALNFVYPHPLEEDFESGTNSNQTQQQSDKYLCVPALHDRTFDESCDTHSAPMGNLPIVVVFGLFLALQGVAKALKSPLGVTYIDNNVSHRSKSGYFIGLLMTVKLFGPPLGFALGGAISQIPVDLSDTPMSPRDPRWVGAWWVGFLICGVLVFAISLPLLFFPRRMPGRHRDNDNTIDSDDNPDNEQGHSSAPGENMSAEAEKSQNIEKGGKDNMYPQLHANGNVSNGNDGAEKESNGNVPVLQSDTDSATKNATFLETLRELPRSLLRLIKNPVYVILVVAMGVYVFAIVGFASFLIKFVQRQFGLPAHISSYVFGLSGLVFSGIGTLIGGVLVSRANLTRRGCLRWVIFAGTVSIVLSAVTIGLGCDDPPMVGLGHSEPFVLDDGLTTCECDVKQYLPVCSGNQTFLSPCHAGCGRAVNTTHFANCSHGPEKDAKVGVCSPGCRFLIPFIVVQVLSSAFGATTVTPVYISILRSMSQKDKTLGVGLLSFMLSLLGFIPGPIVYGAVIDRACLIWESKCGKSGACALYDITHFRHGFIGVEIAGKALALFLYIIALLVLLWQIRTNRTKDDKQVKETELKDGKGGKTKGPKAFEMMRF